MVIINGHKFYYPVYQELIYRDCLSNMLLAGVNCIDLYRPISYLSRPRPSITNKPRANGHFALLQNQGPIRRSRDIGMRPPLFLVSTPITQKDWRLFRSLFVTCFVLWLMIYDMFVSKVYCVRFCGFCLVNALRWQSEFFPNYMSSYTTFKSRDSTEYLIILVIFN